MDRIGIAGLSLHQTDVEGVERAKRGLAACDEPAPLALADRLGASEVVCLSTCNRIEVVYARENGHAPGRADLESIADAFGLRAGDPLRARLFLCSGAGAARHLFRVASSLDSLVLGEDQILAQVRAAWSEARELGRTGHLLSPLFEQALQLGKRVRTATDLARRPVSVVSLGVAFLTERLDARGTRTAARIAVVGAGATGTHAARALVAAGFPVRWVANRSRDRAAALASEVGATALGLDEFRSGRHAIDALVSATAAPEPVLDRAALERLLARLLPHERLVAVDLAVPRDVEPIPDPRLERIDLEALRGQADENRRLRAAAAAEAELLVEEQLAVLARERTVVELTGPYASVLEEARGTFELELAALTSGKLAHLAVADRSAVERWARAVFARLSHVPLRALKRAARAHAPARADWEGHE